MISKTLSNFVKAFVLFFFVLIVTHPITAEAILENYEASDGSKVQRSLESLRDLDYQTWELVAYPESEENDQMRR